MLGLTEVDLAYITKCMEAFEEIKKAVVFGSRAKGNYKIGSDIDIAIFGENITFTTLAALHTMLEDEGPMTYMIDVVDYKTLTNEDLKEHINRFGIVVYDIC